MLAAWATLLPAPAGATAITVSVSGDILTHESLLARARALGGGRAYRFEPMFAGIRPWIRGADLAFCHVETPIAGFAAPAGTPRFNAPPVLADAIAGQGWDACSTASNHALDLEQRGVAATIRSLDRAGLAHTGTYVSRRARRQPLILGSGGIRVALLSYSTGTNGRVRPEPYSVNLVSDPAAVIADARRARRAGADAVLVNIHWTSDSALWSPELRIPGQPAFTAEYSPEPSAGQVRLVESLLASPAISGVVAQGPHVVQPIRPIAGKFAVFSEGNLIAGETPAAMRTPLSRDGLIAFVELAREAGRVSVVGVRYLPVSILRPLHLVVPAAPGSASYERTVAVAGSGLGVGPIGGRR